ncbi:MAG: superoxide dismutase family protein [Tepidisphaeraceae bacterium]|jgi:Cu-Zn family superoxide dismutase
MKHVLLLAVAMVLGCFQVACSADNKEPAKGDKVAVCEIGPTKGNTVKGLVTFTQIGDKVKVVADVSGFEPNTRHGFHIHEGTECGEDGMKAGGHYNPEKHEHGLPDKAMRHAGDFGNLEADKDGKAHLELTVEGITIDGDKNPILGHAMIVHAKLDDGSQPVGNAGARIGCGLIKLKDKEAK